MGRTVHHSPGGKVAMFRMRPRMGFIWLAVVIGLLGGFYVVTLRADAAYDPDVEQRSRLVALVTGMFCLFSLVIATARMWYGHLWHRRK